MTFIAFCLMMVPGLILFGIVFAIMYSIASADNFETVDILVKEFIDDKE